MKVVLVQDWLTEFGGAEHVFKSLVDIFPDADIATLSSHSKVVKKIGIQNRTIKESFISKLPFGRTKYRNYLQFFPKAIESLDLSEYDLVVSSSSSVAKGVITNTNQLHICYCHSPVRYAWDLYYQYLKESNLTGISVKGWYARHILHKLRVWDVISANRVDYFIANSNYIRRRIQKIYRRNSEVIYPPVDIQKFSLCENKDDYYFAASRLVAYKKIDVIVEAFAKMPNKKLIVAGTGPDIARIKKLAAPNIQILGFVSDEQMLNLLQNARAFVFAANEDFGILPVEAQACGTPVIAYGVGGSLETVRDGISGCFFEEQTSESIKSCIESNEELILSLNKKKIRENAEQFSQNIFEKHIREFINIKVKEFEGQ